MKKGLVFIFITTFLFSTMEVVLKYIADVYDPIQLNCLRFLIGGVVLLPFALKRLKKDGIRLRPRDLLPFVWVGFIGVTVSMTLYQFAVVYADASVVAVLLSCNPLFVMIFSYFMLKEPITKSNIIAIALDLLGILIIVSPWKTSVSIIGEILVILAAIIFALYGVCGTKYSKMYGGIVNTCFSSIAGSLLLMIFIGLTNVPSIGSALTNAGLDVFAYIPLFSGFTLQSLPYFLYVCIFVTGISYACYFMAMEETSATMASLVFFFKPILAPIFALIFLNEMPTTSRVTGIVLILIGSMFNLLPKLRQNKNTAAS